MTERTVVGQLQVATVLYDFVNNQVLPDLGISAKNFWKDFGSLVNDLAPENAALLAERDRLQTELN